jgi:hypothetical protein
MNITTTTTDFQRGDIVRFGDHIDEGIVVTAPARVAWPDSVADEDPAKLVLVRRAHYTQPGEALVRMTPERVDALEIAQDAIDSRDEECDYGSKNGFPEMDEERETLESADEIIAAIVAEAAAQGCVSPNAVA